MAYLKYTSLLIFWGWILSVAYIRYILPFIESALDAVDTIEQAGGAFRRGIAFATKVLMAGAQMYVLGTWSAYCVIRTMIFLAPPEASGWLYYPTAFVVCEGFLGAVAKKEKFRGLLSVVHSAMAMGLFVIFAMNPYFLRSVYPWLFPIMNFSLPH